MNRTVPGQIMMVLATIGTYAVTLAASSRDAPGTLDFATFAYTVTATAAIVAGIAFIIAARVVFTVASITAGLAAAATAASFVVIGTYAAATAAAIAAGLTVAAASTRAFDVAATLGIPMRWAFTAYGIEVGAILSALVTGSVGWALAIGAVGTLELLAVWKFSSIAVVRASVPAPAPNGG